MGGRQNAAPNIDTSRIQGLDPRSRMMLQRPQTAVPQQQFQPNQVMQQRMVGPRNQIPEQYDVLHRFPGIDAYTN